MPDNRTMQQHSPIFKLDEFTLWLIFSENAVMDMDLTYTGHLSHRKRDLHPLSTIRSTSQVCSLWRDVLLHSPSLWGQLIDIEALLWGHANWRNEVLSRTGQSLLNVKGCVRFDPEHERRKATGEYFISILDQHWGRIRKLRIEVVEIGVQSTEVARKRWRVLQRPAPNLELFHIHFGLNSLSDIFVAEGYHLFSNNAPSLRHFIPINLNFPLASPCFSQLQTLKLSPYFDVPQILQAFQAMELLQSLSVNLSLAPISDSHPLPDIILPHLRNIYAFGLTGACMPLLDHITPAPGCRLYLETRAEGAHRLHHLETAHRVLARYSKNYVNAYSVQSISINAYLSSFTFFTNTISSINNPMSSDFKFKIDTLPHELSYLLNALNVCNFEKVKTFHVDSRGLLASDPSFMKLFKSLVAVEEVELAPDGMEFLLGTPRENAEFEFFPCLRTIKVSPFILNANTDMIIPFLQWRRNMGKPISTFNLELHPLAGFPVNFAFLEEMKGMTVVWKAGQDSRSYLCGSGDQEVLNFKYDPIQLMYEIRKL